MIVNGIILAEDGAKMSKRLKNYPEPGKVFDQYGVDAVRLYLLSSPAVYAEDLRFSTKDVELVLRQALIPLWNSFSFLSTYAKIYAWKPTTLTQTPAAEIDQWLLSVTQKLIQEVTEAMDSYELHKAAPSFIQFIEQLTNWYIRRNRGRFWSEIASQDRDEAFSTLYTAILTLCKVAAPFIPFITETIYQQLRKDDDLASIHLMDFPVADPMLRNPKLELDMSIIQSVVSLGHALRKEHKIKVRQPLAKAYVVTTDPQTLATLQSKEHLILEELNVKELVYLEDETRFVQLIAKPNFRILGKKVGSKMGLVQKKIAELDYSFLNKLLQGHSIELSIEGDTLSISPEEITVERKTLEGTIAATLQNITIALDMTLSPSLVREGIARELVNRINTLRKELGFSITDRIIVQMKTSPLIQESFLEHKEFICHEVLAKESSFEDSLEGSCVEINAEPVLLVLTRA